LINVEVKNNINIPIDDIAINLDKQLYEIANTIVIRHLQDLIRTSTAVDGSSFPPLEPSTIAIKKKHGGGSKQLIDTGLLYNSFMAYRPGKGKVIVRIKPGRRQVGEYLQIDGVGKAQKHFYFFGISDGMERDCIYEMKLLLRKLING